MRKQSSTTQTTKIGSRDVTMPLLKTKFIPTKSPATKPCNQPGYNEKPIDINKIY